jgi:hypothetical protein
VLHSRAALDFYSSVTPFNAFSVRRICIFRAPLHLPKHELSKYTFAFDLIPRSICCTRKAWYGFNFKMFKMSAIEVLPSEVKTRFTNCRLLTPPLFSKKWLESHRLISTSESRVAFCTQRAPRLLLIWQKIAAAKTFCDRNLYTSERPVCVHHQNADHFC